MNIEDLKPGMHVEVKSTGPFAFSTTGEITHVSQTDFTLLTDDGTPLTFDDYYINLVTIITGQHEPHCTHEFRLYQGLLETYEYCTRCDDKKEN